MTTTAAKKKKKKKKKINPSASPLRRRPRAARGLFASSVEAGEHLMAMPAATRL
jgi:hypothetical protein